VERADAQARNRSRHPDESRDPGCHVVRFTVAVRPPYRAEQRRAGGFQHSL